MVCVIQAQQAVAAVTAELKAAEEKVEAVTAQLETSRCDQKSFEGLKQVPITCCLAALPSLFSSMLP